MNTQLKVNTADADQDQTVPPERRSVVPHRRSSRVKPPEIAFSGERHIPPTPPELHDEVLNFVISTEDYTTIISCALTCRRWLSRCKGTFFRVVRLHSGRQAFAFLQAVKSSTTGLGYRVEELEIHHNTSESLAWGHLILLKLSKLLPNMRTARYLCNNTPISPTHPRLPLRFRSFTALQTISIEKYTFESFTDLLRLVGHAKSLAVLECNEVTCGYIPDTPPEHRIERSQLVCVRAVACNFSWAIPWFWAASPAHGWRSTVLHSGNEPESFSGLSIEDALVVRELCRHSSVNADRRKKASKDSAIELDVEFKFTQSPKPHRWFLQMITRIKEENYAIILFKMRHKHGIGAVVDKVMFRDTSFAALRSVYDWPTVNKLLLRFPDLRNVVIDMPKFFLKTNDKKEQDKAIAECGLEMKHKLISTTDAYHDVWGSVQHENLGVVYHPT